jgi:hypothetical protein
MSSPCTTRGLCGKERLLSLMHLPNSGRRATADGHALVIGHLTSGAVMPEYARGPGQSRIWL